MPDSERTNPERRGRVVVGIDGSDSSRGALEWALAYAAAMDLPVTAVQAWQVPANYGAAAMVLPAAEFAESARDTLERTVREAAAARPQVTVERIVQEGHAAKVLLEAAADATLLVVGSRGHGGFVGAVLGSVSQYCVTHARCPVLIYRGE
ncbi:universal stress protein [Glycomyces terrestris]|uniref:Universal stress protein n=1 Tax=Glycomyces terrestris TaxID=2493553 RepID=A0A426V3X3_9ACTN|nr:universal stress protein [Glycomyces terrestris]RRS01552.1 universal stress protein [Glycomyces terrestris]